MTTTPDATPREPRIADAPDTPVAIVGIGALYAGSTTTQGFWGDIVTGRECITEVPPTHWRVEDYFDPDPAAVDKIYSRRGGFLPEIDFSPLRFGIPPATLPAIDTVQLLALVVAERVVTDMASRAFASVDRDRISVILGVASTTELVTEMVGRLQRPRLERALRAAGLPEPEVQRVSGIATDAYVPWQDSTFPGMLGNVVAGRVASRLDFGGSNFVVDAACGSSLAAVQAALNELYLRRADLVITGGVDALNEVLMYKCFGQIGATSRTGQCRPFSANADGTLLGEGVGMFALKRVADAERDGDHIYAVIRGLGSSSDGRALSIYAPRAEGQAKALANAYARAGYGPESVELVEAHGTGTNAGDLAEVEALRRVFGEARPDTRWCALGSVKSQIGHAKAAAGAAGLFKVAMALHHRILPPTINVERPDPRLKLDESPFYLNTEARPWVKAPGEPRRASVSSFGFGGANFHVTLEEYDGPAPRAPRLRTMPSELLLLSAHDREGLADACRACARRLAEPGAALDAVARETQRAFSARAAERVALVVADVGEGVRELERGADAIVADGPIANPDMLRGRGEALGKIAFLFPGQGSQRVGMGADLAMRFEVVRQAWDQASRLAGASAQDLADHVFPPAPFDDDEREALEGALRATEVAQPAIATASFAATALLRQLGVAPALVAGHSLGELTALAAAGVFDFESLLVAASARGRLMGEAAARARPSGMMSVFTARERVEEIIQAHAPGVIVANHNSPQQTVISGENTALEAAERAFGAAGIGFVRLRVAAAFHSPMVAEAATAFAAFLAGHRSSTPRLPVYSHVTATPYGEEGPALSAQLGRAIVSPVRFVEQVEALYRDGARVFVEPGPGDVLTRLVGACLKDRPHVAVAVDRRDAHGVTSLWRALGALAAAGVSLDLAPLWEGQVLSSQHARPADATTVRISGANFGKRYPLSGDDAATGRPLSNGVPAAPPLASPSLPAAIPGGAPAAVGKAPVQPSVPSSTLPLPGLSATAPGAVGPAPMPPTLAAPSVPVPGPRSAHGNAWLDAFSALQEQTAAAHADFQRVLADRHAAFLQASMEGLRQLAALAGAAPSDGRPLEVAGLGIEPRGPVLAPTPAVDLGSAMAPPPVPVSVTPRVDPRVPSASVEDRAPTPSRSVMLLDIVAEKTGYPREALDLAMDLESDLGIDSIKRVEILAAASDRIPDLPRLQTDRLAAMRTLAQIAAYIDSAADGNGKPHPMVPENGTPTPSRSVMLLDIVAEKTGYPREALDLAMDLESDLGIDSIKRVEILAAASDRIPDLPRLQTDRLAAMRTLAQIAAYIDGAANGNGKPHPTAASQNGSRMSAQVPPERPSPAAAPIERWVPTLHDAPAPGSAVIDLWNGERIFVLGDAGGVAQVLVARLGEEGIPAEVVASVPAAARRIVLLGRATAASIDEALAAGRDLLGVVASRARDWEGEEGLLVAVEHGEDSAAAGAEAWLGGLAALTRSAEAELPLLTVKAIRLVGGFPDAAAIADAIVAELVSGGAEAEVHLSANGRRRSARREARVLVPGDLPVGPGSVVVVTGGARGITPEAVIALAQRVELRILLLGRTRLDEEPVWCRGVQDVTELTRLVLEHARARGEAAGPSDVRAAVARIGAAREISETLARLRAAGSEVRYVSTDITDAHAVAEVVGAARRDWGPIEGIVHGAGVVADAWLRDKEASHVERVFAPKLLGLANLLAATAGDPLRFLCTFSSVAAHAGNPGQADYAMANSILERVCAAEAARRGPSCRVRALAWGPWDGGMVKPHLREKFAREGVRLIDKQAGGYAFVDELCGSGVETTIGLTAAPPAGRADSSEAHHSLSGLARHAVTSNLET